MMNFLTVKRRSTGEYLYINRKCELLGLTNEILSVKVSGRVEQFHTDYFYFMIGNFYITITE